MSKFRRGDLVLVPMIVDSEPPFEQGWVPLKAGTAFNPRINLMNTTADQLTPHPGVPVADLVRECELARAFIGSFRESRPAKVDAHEWCEYCNLRDAREAAGKPKFQEGQEVWVRAECSGFKSTDPDKIVVTYDEGAHLLRVHPDDIRTDAPHGAENPDDSA